MVTGTLIFATAVITIGSGFQHGYNIAVLNTPETIIKGWIKEELHNTSDESLALMWGVLVSIYCVGGMVGGMLSGLIANGLGRRMGLIVNNLIAILAAIFYDISPVTKLPYLLFVGRFIVGLNSGLNAGLAPLFISEISPTKIRGALGSLYQLNITIAILLAMLLGSENVMGTKDTWHHLLALVGPVGLIQLVCLFFVPESPKYSLERKHDEETAKKALQKFIGDDFASQYEELQQDIQDSRNLPVVTLKEMVTASKLRKPLIIICLLMVAQQLSGINAVMFYSTNIFKMAEFSNEAAQNSSIGVGIVNVITTVVSVWFVELFGRKPLLLGAFGGMIGALVFLLVTLSFIGEAVALSYASIGLVYIYVIFFAVGAGGIPWMLGPELFNTASRPLAVSLAVVTNWMFAFLVGLAFPPLQAVMYHYTFIIFVVCNILAYIYIWIFVPETKNKRISEITALFD